MCIHHEPNNTYTELHVLNIDETENVVKLDSADEVDKWLNKNVEKGKTYLVLIFENEEEPLLYMTAKNHEFIFYFFHTFCCFAHEKFFVITFENDDHKTIIDYLNILYEFNE